MSTKMTVHNLSEVKALIKEAFQRGDEGNYHHTKWYKHTGEFLAHSFIGDVEFELVVEDIQELDGYKSVFVEVL